MGRIKGGFLMVKKRFSLENGSFWSGILWKPGIFLEEWIFGGKSPGGKNKSENRYCYVDPIPGRIFWVGKRKCGIAVLMALSGQRGHVCWGKCVGWVRGRSLESRRQLVENTGTKEVIVGDRSSVSITYEHSCACALYGNKHSVSLSPIAAPVRISSKFRHTGPVWVHPIRTGVLKFAKTPTGPTI